MSATLYDICNKFRKTDIPYSVCGAPLGIKITQEEYEEMLPKLQDFRDASTLNIDYVFNSTTETSNAYYKTQVDYSGPASRHPQSPCKHVLMADNITYLYSCPTQGTNPINLCDQFPPLRWAAKNFQVIDEVEHKGGQFEDRSGNMCWHPLVIKCQYYTFRGPLILQNGVWRWMYITACKHLNPSCSYASYDNNFDIYWPGVSISRNNEYILFSPLVVYRSYAQVFGSGPSFQRTWGEGCVCSPIFTYHFLTGIAPYSCPSGIYGGGNYSGGGGGGYSCNGDLFKQGGGNYFPSQGGATQNSTLVFDPKIGYYSKASENYNVTGETYENSIATWQFTSAGCWEFRFSNIFRDPEEIACGNVEVAVYVRLCPGNITPSTLTC